MNLFAVPDELPAEELVDRIANGDNVLVERIVSTGQATPPGEWLEQERDEWVVLLQGQAGLSFADGTRVLLAPGDHALVPGGVRHRVERTSRDPACIWLAVHSTGFAKPTS